MGLRINTNLSALTALRTLQINDRALRTTLERMATGLRINRASDDPSGMVISEQLRAQTEALKQALENTQHGINISNTADASLQEVQNLLVDIQESIIFAMNKNAVSADQLAAEQAAVDYAIQAIDRIAATSRYGDINLLNGNAEFAIVSNLPAIGTSLVLQDIRIRSVFFAQGEQTKSLSIRVITNPERGAITISSDATNAALTPVETTLRITGPRGTVDIVLPANSTGSGIARAVNSVAGYTGVWASGLNITATSSRVTLFTEEFGSAQSVKMEVISGEISGNATIDGVPTGLTEFTTGEILYDTGRDGVVEFQGQRYEGTGREFYIYNRVATFAFKLNPDILPLTTPYQVAPLVVADTGFRFQLKEKPLPGDRVTAGIEGIYAAKLGTNLVRDKIQEAIVGGWSPAALPAAQYIYRGGFISSILTGGPNDLFTNPENAGVIVKAAIDRVSQLRSFLGALISQNLTPNLIETQVEQENLTASLSTIRDLDFAQELADFTRRQVLFQANLSTLAASNLMPQGVLALLGGV